MTQTLHALTPRIRKHGGWVHRGVLLDAGWKPHQVLAVRRAEGIDLIRRQWLVLPDAPEEVREAARLGGVLTGVSALERLRLWVPPELTGGDRIHIGLRADASVRPGPRTVTDRARPIAPRPPRELVDAVENVLRNVAVRLPHAQALAIWESVVRSELVTVEALQRMRWRSRTTARSSRWATPSCGSRTRTSCTTGPASSASSSARSPAGSPTDRRPASPRRWRFGDDLKDPPISSDARRGVRSSANRERRRIARPRRPRLIRMWSLARAVSPRIDEVAQTGSTNADLTRALREGEDWPHLGVLLTRDQRGGRGRLDRTWVAPAGSALAVSVVVRAEQIPAERRGWIPLVAGVAMARAASAQLPRPAGVKWPNDVLVGERKLSGILAEVATADAIVVGSGVNTRMTAAQLPVDTATSFAVEGVEADEDALLAGYLRGLRDLLARLERGSVRDDVRAACVTLGRAVTVHLPSGRLEGTAVDLADDGSLVVDAGERVAVSAGDVVHVRPR